MPEILVGVNLPQGNADPEFLESRLRAFAEAGFDCVEVGLDVLPLIVAGEPRGQYVDFLQGLLHRFPLRYSAHIGLGVDLRDLPRQALQRKVLETSIGICARLGLDPLVLHYEQASRDSRVEAAFTEGHARAADQAAREGLTLCIENIEVERFEPLLELVRQVDRQNFRIAFDTGHAWLSAHYFHFDFLQAFRSCLPRLGHLHLSDNPGLFEELRIRDRPAYDALPMRYRYAFGSGDIHLPPFWGSVPFDDLLRLLHPSGYRGMYVCEYYSEHFLPFARSIQERVRAAVEGARVGP